MTQRHFDLEEKIILRDYLALERTRLANERTLLSYVRTSLYFLLGGVALLQVEGMEKLEWLAYVGFAVSALLLIAGVVKYLRLRKTLQEYYTMDPGKSIGGD